jgi:hypothetical protein
MDILDDPVYSRHINAQTRMGRGAMVGYSAASSKIPLHVAWERAITSLTKALAVLVALMPRISGCWLFRTKVRLTI